MPEIATSKKPKRRGAPSKRNPAVIKRGLAVAKDGLPMRFVAGAMGISHETLSQWRKDPEFDQALESARTEGVLSKFRKILEVGRGKGGAPPKWEALAWALERAYCAEFSRPEIQLHQLNTQVNQVNQTIVITAEQASHLRERNANLDKQLDEISRAYETKRGRENGSNGADPVREIESSLVPSVEAIMLPPPAGRTRGWWKSLSSGDGSRGIGRAAATHALKEIVTEVAGSARAGGLKVKWDAAGPTLADLWSAISESCGGVGWEALVARGSKAELGRR